MVTTGKNERVFDQRVVSRNIAAGRLTKEEYAEYLESLPDAAENIKARDEGGDDDGYERPISAANEPRRPLPLPITRPRLDDDDDDDDDDLDDDDLDDDDDDDDGGGESAGSDNAGTDEA